MKRIEKVTSIGLSMITVFSMCSVTAFAQNDTLESKYDLRDSKCVTSVKSQAPFGTCWDFAGIAAAESALIKQGLADDKIDLSEEAVLWTACSSYVMQGIGWHTISKNDGMYSATFLSAATSKGLYLESDIPYDTNEDNEFYMEELRPKALDECSPVFRATGVVYPNVDNRDDIKRTIKEYGAIATSMFLEENNKPGVNAFWEKEKVECNHSINVIGWDDNYSKDNFAKIDGALPQTDGAWLIKNSSLSDNIGGYLWVSYSDACIFEKSSNNVQTPSYAFSSFEKIDNSKTIVENENYGATTYNKGTDSVWANVMDFSVGKDYLRNAVFATLDGAGHNYTLYIANVDSQGKPVTDQATYKKLAEGTIPNNGYINVQLDSPYKVEKGKVAIVLKIDGAVSLGICASISKTDGRGLFTPNVSDDKMCYKIENGKATSYQEFGLGFGTVAIKLYTTNKADDYMAGDVDLNGSVTIKDAVYIQKYLAKSIELTPEQQANAKFGEFKDKIVVGCVVKIQKYIAGLIPSLES